MATVEDRPDKGPIGPYLRDQLVDFIVGYGPLHCADFIVPGSHIFGQEDFIQIVGLVQIAGARRLPGAMSCKIQIDIVLGPGFGRQLPKPGNDIVFGRPLLARAVESLNIVLFNFHLAQDAPHQLHVIIRSRQLKSLFKVWIVRDPDEKPVFARIGGLAKSNEQSKY